MQVHPNATSYKCCLPNSQGLSGDEAFQREARCEAFRSRLCRPFGCSDLVRKSYLFWGNTKSPADWTLWLTSTPPTAMDGGLSYMQHSTGPMPSTMQLQLHLDLEDRMGWKDSGHKLM